MNAFDRALERTLGFEGGESDTPGDRGGHTKWGVTQAAYDRWRVKRSRPLQNVSSMTVDEMRDFYCEEYWAPVRGDELPEALALVAFDMAVHSGARAAALALQRALGVQVDGAIGPITLRAAKAAGLEAVLRFLKARGNHIQKTITAHPSDVQFLEGWINRLLDQAWRPTP